MAKRLSEKEKKEIVQNFISGKTIDELSEDFNCTKLTISRNLKKNLEEKKYKEIIKKNKLSIQKFEESKNSVYIEKKKPSTAKTKNQGYGEEYFSEIPFLEIAPLNYVIDNKPQKDLSSVPISEIEFPEIVYMIVDKKIELETKYLKEYPNWQFLSKDDLNRKTIEIYYEIKNAKRFCNKEQKVIKVPNPNVFKIVGPTLISRGITRIIGPEILIAL